MMRTVLLCSLALANVASGFQFMKGWKMPTVDPNAAQIEEKFGDKKLVVVTGTSSGLGRKAALALLRSGEYHVIGAVRDLDKMEAVAEVDGFDMDNFTPMYCEMNSFDSVRDFCQQVNDFRMSKPVDRLVCNAGVYQPSLRHAKWSMDGHEQTMQINFLSHFLMISLLLESMLDSRDPRVTMVGSVTGNDNTVGGGGVYPIANLHELDGFKAGFKKPIEMADGYGFIGAKAYKDSKLALMMTANYLHTKYHKLTGVSFSSLYPGCIAESPLFREKRAWFRKYFPIFMKFITGGFVGEHEAGQRLFQVVHDPRCSKSGVYWSWNGGPREGRGAEAIEKGGQISGGGGAGGGWDSIFENDQSSKVLDIDTATKLFQYATEITGAEWPKIRQVTSPCPTLKVIGAVTKGMTEREELKRMRELGRPGMADGVDAARQKVEALRAMETTVVVPEQPVVPVKPVKLSKRKRVAAFADKVVAGTLKHTVGRVGKFVSNRVLGDYPEEAITGSYDVPDETPAVPAVKAVVAPVEQAPAAASSVVFDGSEEEKQQMLEDAISEYLAHENSAAASIVKDAEDEALFRQIYEEERKRDRKSVV